MERITVQKVTLNDIEQLQQIGRQTFSETFSSGNTKENMNKYLAETFSFEKLTDELNNENSEFYFALSENEVIGYQKINFGKSQTELQDEKALEIERIYVLKEFHSKKLGKCFMKKRLKLLIREMPITFG